MTRLLPYQLEGVEAIGAFGGRALLADSMGLGKTLQALTYIKQNSLSPAVVVCPAGLKLHWKKEAWDHCRLKSEVLYGQSVWTLSNADLFIVNYEILSFWARKLMRLKPRIVVIDEVHMIGNRCSKRCRATTALCKDVPAVIGISGTPLTNRPAELYPILHILRPELFSSPFAFGMEYCLARFQFGRWDFRGARNLPKLHKLLKKSCMIRRTREEVLPQLPPKTVGVVPLEMSDPREYQKAERDLISWLAETKSLEIAQRAASNERYSQFTYLKQLAAQLKMGSVKSWMESFMEESTGKLLIGTLHKKTISTLHMPGCVVIDGSKTEHERELAVKRFREDPDCRLMLGQIKAAGVGLNLPECHNVGLAEIPWNAATCEQFIDRCYRMTTKSPVQATYFVAANSIEEVLCDIVQRKETVFDAIIDGGEGDKTADLFSLLQKALRKRSRT